MARRRGRAARRWQADSQGRRRGRATHPSPLDGNSERGKFAEGSIWLISAYVPMEAIQRCLRAADARSDGREITGHSSHGPPVTMLAPDGEASERRVPSSVRHVALRPIIPANPRKRRKRHPVGALLRSMLYGAGQGWRSGLHARGEARRSAGCVRLQRSWSISNNLRRGRVRERRGP